MSRARPLSGESHGVRLPTLVVRRKGDRIVLGREGRRLARQVLAGHELEKHRVAE